VKEGEQSFDSGILDGIVEDFAKDLRRVVHQRT